MRAAEFFQRCLDAGIPTDMALTAMRAFEAEVEIVIDITLDKRRSKDRERQAKKRERDHVRSREVTLQPVTNVTTRDQRDAKDAPAPVHTRGEETLPRLVDKPNLTTLNASEDAGDDLDWPGEAKPSRAYLDRLEAALFAAGAPALNLTAPKILSLAAILALGREGKGPPCDLQADVLPTVRAKCARAPPTSISAWDYLVPAICEARDRRLRGAPESRPSNQSQPHERPPQQSAKFAAKQANMDRAFNGAQRAIARAAR